LEAFRCITYCHSRDYANKNRIIQEKKTNENNKNNIFKINKRMHQVLFDLNLVDRKDDCIVTKFTSTDISQHGESHSQQQQFTLTSCDVLNQLLSDQLISEKDIRDAFTKLTNQMQYDPKQQEKIYSNPSENHENAAKSTDENPTPNIVVPIINEQNDNTQNSKNSVVDTSSLLQPNKTNNQQTHQNRTRHIAFHIYYDGSTYSGLAENVGSITDQSIERELFKALTKSNLIENNTTRERIQYSRCGRTDRGVSAVGQIVALHVKSAIPLLASYDKDGIQPVLSQNLPSTNPLQSITVWVPPTKKIKNRSKNITKKSKQSVECTSMVDTLIPDVNNDVQQQQEVEVESRIERTIVEYQYDKILNNLLPVEIRVLGWCPVTDDFSARFSAMTRTYRYFFTWRPIYNMNRINTALQLLVGHHDYRNFCKMDIEKVYNFQRKIISCKLIIDNKEFINTIKENTTSTSTEAAEPSIQSTCYIQIEGQAFLWHQIRCIAHIVLDLIGCGYEEPNIITELFNIEKYGGKPSYPLADELPLVLHDCQYTNLPLQYTVSNLWNVSSQLEEVWDKLILHAKRIRNCIDSLSSKNVYKCDIVSYISTTIEKISKKQKCVKCTLSNTNTVDTSIMNLEAMLSFLTEGSKESDKCTWGEALTLLEQFGLLPDPKTKMKLLSYTPLLQRSKGTTYEEKVAALTTTSVSLSRTQEPCLDSLQKVSSSSSSQQQQSINSKRRQRYEDNVIRKRKTVEEDAAFYNHMTKQGGIG
jgi:tRNA pseudouridine38/39 synthase